MTITILGPGCPNCKNLKNNVDQALNDLGLKDVEVEQVSEINTILDTGVTNTPGVMIDGEVMSVGRIPEAEEIKSWLK